MADLADFKEPSEGLADWCERIAEHKTRFLLTPTLFTKEEIEQLSHLFQKAIDLASELKGLPLDNLPEYKLISLRGAAKIVATKFGELSATVITVSDPSTKADLSAWKQKHHDFTGDFVVHCRNFCNESINVIPYLSLKADKSRSEIEEIDVLLADIKEKSKTALEEFGGKHKELDQIIQVARDTAAQAGVAQHATRFGEISDGHSSASRKWLVAAIVLVLLTVGFAVLALFYLPPPSDLKDTATIQRVIGKLVIISILYYGALWSAKNYRTHRHLAVLNVHRQSALQTFDAFIKAASGDEQTKNAVLLEATRCIFAQANTGYLGAEDDNQSNRIIEIIKMVGSGSATK